MELLREWYFFLSRLSAAIGEPLSQVAGRTEFPMVGALVFGLIGATSPCQLTTNLSAIAYVSRRLGEGRAWVEAVAYTLGKVLVYTLVGGAAIALGGSLQDSALPVVVFARRLLGPLMLVIGLVLLGVLSLRISVGQRISDAIARRAAPQGSWGAFVMGVVFSFAFCPTLFLLFFGLAIPLGLRTDAGLLVPATFAIGTALPLLAYAGLLAAGNGLAGGYARHLSGSHRAVRRIAGALLLLAGINDTLTYWAL